MRFDVAILGSGFAGSLTALLLERIGRSCVVIDKAQHPRFAIGESSTPTGNLILKDLAEKYGLPQLAPLTTYSTWRNAYPRLTVGKKRGFSYFQHLPNQSFQPTPNHTHELLVTASAHEDLCDTHWLREEVDHFLVDEVREAGIPVFEKAQITSLAAGTPWRLTLNHQHLRKELQADFLIDATGRAGFLPQTLQLPDHTSSLHTHSRALYTHFENVPLWQEYLESANANLSEYPFRSDDAALHQVLDRAWMWQLRFHTGRLSAGLVLDSRHHPATNALSPAEEWARWLNRYPSLQHQFEAATPAAKPGAILRTGRLQRLWGQSADANWALLPHTAGFIDPLHSTGIAHSLSGIEHLISILEGHWQKATLPDELALYDQRLQQEFKLVDLLVAGSYAGMGAFELLVPYTMVYFAGAIMYEETRQAGLTPEGFLCAGHRAFAEVVQQAYHLSQTYEGPAFTDEIERLIAPFNNAGLFNPTHPNMYYYTAADL